VSNYPVAMIVAFALLAIDSKLPAAVAASNAIFK
jgi:hypothetical protein